MSYSNYCAKEQLPWHTDYVSHWLGALCMEAGCKFKATSTLQQKLSHINCLLAFKPKLIRGHTLDLQDLAKGLGGLKAICLKDHILPPSFLITMSLLKRPQVLHIAVQFQALTGLRGGQMSLITAEDLKRVHFYLWAAPFKHRLVPLLVDIRQVPQWLVQAFLSFSTEECAPILPYTPSQYKQLFKELTASYGLSQASHAARHTFASVQRSLDVPLYRIQQAMTHDNEKSLGTYLHPLIGKEMRVVLQHPQYFVPLRLYN